VLRVLRIDEGSGSFVFRDGAAGTRGSMRVFHVRPRSLARDPRIVIALHGFDRAAEAFRDTLAGEATRRGLIVLVPEFDRAAFPDAYAYNYGNVVAASPGTAVMPRDQWTFGIIERLFQQVKAALRSDRETFSLFGNSAGAQFVLRYLALNDAAAVDRAVAANSGWYMLPDLTVRYPDGMGGIDLDENCLRRYLGRDVTILLGEADTDSNAPDLPRMEAAIAQGPHRLARGLWSVSHCKQVAARERIPFGWTVEIVQGAGHVSQPIYDRAVAILAG
jgi:poly(3-hydroxybutyrate) depolymerase